MISLPRPALAAVSTVLIAALALAAAACGGSSAKTVKVSLQDFSINPDQSTASHGKIKFQVTNAGPSEHEFVILKTDVPADQLPVSEEKADEEAAGVQGVDELEEFESNLTKDLTVSLDPGKYVFICNIAAHYQQGMRVGFTVS